MALSKLERLRISVNRLAAAEPARNARAAFRLLSETLNAVEDEFSGVPFNPDLPLSDGRMYAPQDDNRHVVSGRPDLVRYRSKGHHIYIGQKGALRIFREGRIELDKPGADGRTIGKI